MKTKPMLLWVTLALCCAGAQAQKLTPGLWEHQVTMKTGSGQMEAAMAQMQAQLAAMPPEKPRVDIALTTGGSTVEVLVGDNEPDDAPDLRRVARQEGATDVVRLGVPSGTTARFVLIWITTLPKEGGGYREGIDELVLVR